MNFCAIVVAAGRGVRFGRSKQTIDVAGRPLAAWAIGTFGELSELEHMVIATETEHLSEFEALAARFAPRLRTRVVAGGATRQQSARNALRTVPRSCDAVFIHDGARPLITAADVRAGMSAVAPGVGAVIATPVVDTIKVVSKDGRSVVRTLDRAELWAAQTPQFATVVDLRAAHTAAERDEFEATDDVALLERIGLAVTVVPASGENFKVTFPADRDRAEALLRARTRETIAAR